MSSIKVLLVDDTQHVREMLAHMLELSGFEVVGKASSGPDGIELAENTGPDVIVMDYKMPGMDGITATEHIRAKAPALPVILYTAYLDDELRARARRAGVNVCVGKVEGLHLLEREIAAICLELVDPVER